MIEEPAPSYSLLITAAKCLSPVAYGIPATLTSNHMLHTDVGQYREQIIVGDSTLVHLGPGVRVDDLVAQSSDGQVWPLWDKNKL